MTNPWPLIMNGAPLKDVLSAIGECDDSQLEGFSIQSTGDPARIAQWISNQAREIGATRIFVYGALLRAFQLGTLTDGGESLTNLMREIGVSKTQLYRCIAVWSVFHQDYQKDPKVFTKFPIEAIKVLASNRTPDSARQFALQQAREGKDFSTKEVLAVVKKHRRTNANDSNVECNETSGNSTGRKLLYRDEFVFVYVRAKNDLEAIRMSLLQALRRIEGKL